MGEIIGILLFIGIINWGFTSANDKLGDIIVNLPCNQVKKNKEKEE